MQKAPRLCVCQKWNVCVIPGYGRSRPLIGQDRSHNAVGCYDDINTSEKKFNQASGLNFINILYPDWLMRLDLVVQCKCLY